MGLGGSNPSPGANRRSSMTRDEKGRKKQEMKTTYVSVVVLVLVVLLSTVPSLAQAAPSLRTDQLLYTTREKQVTLVGSGLTPSLTYYVWIKGPADNKTHFTQTSFTSVAGGLIPSGIDVFSLKADTPPGTYLISLSTSTTDDNSQATTHFGVWGTLKPLYQRTEPIKVVGGGLFPGTSVRLTIRNPAGNFILQTSLATTGNGAFNDTWRTSEDAITDLYTVFIDGTGTFDNPQQDYVSQFKFTVTPAVLSLNVTQQPNQVYQRTEEAMASLTLKYPDGSPVLKSKPEIHPVVLLKDQGTVGFASLTLVDAANGIWSAGVKILVNATTSGKYRFELPAMSFDDGYGNKGGSGNTFSDYFQVRNASLRIRSEVNGTQIQIPFGGVSIISTVTYPDGSPLANGTVRLVVSTGSTVSELKSVYDPSIRAWRAAYSSTFSDLLRPGTWTLNVTAADTLGNSGSVQVKVQAQPYLFIVLVGFLIAAALIGRWIISRYGRRVYFRIRKIIQRFRPAPLG